MVVACVTCFLRLLTDGNTVECCENNGVKDQNGNDLRLCSAIDEERVQAEKSDKCTTFEGYSQTFWDCNDEYCSDKASQYSFDSDYCTVKKMGTHIHQHDGISDCSYPGTCTYDARITCNTHKECLKYSCKNESYLYSMTQSCPAYPYPESLEFKFLLNPELYKSWEQSIKTSESSYSLISSSRIESSGKLVGLSCRYKSCGYR